MNRIKELDDLRPQLEPWVENTAARMGESAVCLSIFTKDYKKGIDSLLQLALSVVMDKPLYLLVPIGEQVPQHVRKISSAIEFYDPASKASFEAATERLLKHAKEKHLSA